MKKPIHDNIKNSNIIFYKMYKIIADVKTLEL